MVLVKYPFSGLTCPKKKTIPKISPRFAIGDPRTVPRTIPEFEDAPAKNAMRVSGNVVATLTRVAPIRSWGIPRRLATSTLASPSQSAPLITAVILIKKIITSGI